MIEYWSAVGRLVARPKFRDEIFKCRKPSRTHSDLGELYQFLCGGAQCKLRLARWEVCDVNRLANVLDEARKEDGVKYDLKLIADAWECADLDEDSLEHTALLGLLAIDEALLAAYLGKTKEEIFDRSQNPPVFSLSPDEAEKFFKFFEYKDDKGVTCRSALQRLIDAERAWIPPEKTVIVLGALAIGLSAVKALFMDTETKVQCSGGQTFMPEPMPKKLAYTHLQPAFVDRLAARLVPRVSDFLGI